MHGASQQMRMLNVPVPVFSYWQLQEQEKKKAYAAELQAQMQERQAQRQQERQQRFGGPMTGVSMHQLGLANLLVTPPPAWLHGCMNTLVCLLQAHRQARPPMALWQGLLLPIQRHTLQPAAKLLTHHPLRRTLRTCSSSSPTWGSTSLPTGAPQLAWVQKHCLAPAAMPAAAARLPGCCSSSNLALACCNHSSP